MRPRCALGIAEPPPHLSETEATDQRRDAVISNLLKAVTVRAVPLSLIFRITAETENARKSALIADTISKLYILNRSK